MPSVAHERGGHVLVVDDDIMMPVMNGLEFLALKTRDRTIAPIPVVLMTARLSA